MVVYTPVARAALERLLADYRVGALRTHRGIQDGIEHTNYFVVTTQGEFVLNLFEELSARELPYFLNLMSFLAARGVPCAAPVPDRCHRLQRTLAGRPAVLVRRLRGASIMQPTPAQCDAVGRVLGMLARVGAGFTGERSDARGPAWRQATAQKLLPLLDPEDASLIRDELNYQAHLSRPDAPRGVIHADLFRDNVLFAGERVAGIIDFYHACNDLLLYDLAVTVNDWCSRCDGSPDSERFRTLVGAYAGERPLAPGEAEAWTQVMRAAALRFWLSRLEDQLLPRRRGSIGQTKDPGEFRRILVHRREDERALEAAWFELVANPAGRAG
jgi:homoserine kinase type II